MIAYYFFLPSYLSRWHPWLMMPRQVLPWMSLEIHLVQMLPPVVPYRPCFLREVHHLFPLEVQPVLLVWQNKDLAFQI